MNIPQHRRKKVHSGPLTRSQKRRQKEHQRNQRRRQRKSKKVSFCEIQFPGVLKAPDGSTVKTHRRIPQKFKKPRDI